MNNFEQHLISVLLEGTSTGEDTEATSRKVHKFVQKDKEEHGKQRAKEHADAGRERAKREFDAKYGPTDPRSGRRGGKNIPGDPVFWAQGGGGKPSPKGSKKVSAQVERIRQKVLDRKREKGQSEDSIEQEKKTWGAGMWKETGKRHGEGGRSSSQGGDGGDRRGSEESGGGRRGSRGDRRSRENQPDKKKWRFNNEY